MKPEPHSQACRPDGPNPAARWLVSFLILLSSGCSSMPGSPSFFPSGGSTLTKETKALRAAVPPDLPRELAKLPYQPFTAAPGDILLVQPADFDSPLRLPGDQPVLPDGTICLGRHGRLAVVGLTLEQIELAVRARIVADGRDPGPIVARVINRTNDVVYVLGEVHAPGAFPLLGRETVLDAILIAGGLSERASHKNIILARPTPSGACHTVLPVCYDDMVQIGDTSTNYQILPGDRIFVPTKSFWESCK